MGILSAERVSEIYKGCLFRSDDTASEKVYVEGVYKEVVFGSGRLAGREGKIELMLKDLYSAFLRPHGASFLMSCIDHRGKIWTDDLWSQEQLYVLGVAIGKVQVVGQSKERHRLTFGIPDIRVCL